MKNFLIGLLLVISPYAFSQEDNYDKQELKLGEQVDFLFNNYKFLEVVADSRCPEGATCVMAGWAIVKLQITLEGDTPYVVEVKIPAAISSSEKPEILVMESGEHILAGALNPYPTTTTAKEDREYSLELWVLKDN